MKFRFPANRDRARRCMGIVYSSSGAEEQAGPTACSLMAGRSGPMSIGDSHRRASVDERLLRVEWSSPMDTGPHRGSGAPLCGTGNAVVIPSEGRLVSTVGVIWRKRIRSAAAQGLSSSRCALATSPPAGRMEPPHSEGDRRAARTDALPVVSLAGGMKLTLLSPTPSKLDKMRGVAQGSSNDRHQARRRRCRVAGAGRTEEVPAGRRRC